MWKRQEVTDGRPWNEQPVSPLMVLPHGYEVSQFSSRRRHAARDSKGRTTAA